IRTCLTTPVTGKSGHASLHQSQVNQGMPHYTCHQTCLTTPVTGKSGHASLYQSPINQDMPHYTSHRYIRTCLIFQASNKIRQSLII
ncbi:uncharacterized protein LOC143280276, partial [Babylonia areolata]|uniref:uncharacterized protein LOC143280276 n=1 Tax=Babylonia areolata TaxID=304850 RepID=UPI003FD4E3D7